MSTSKKVLLTGLVSTGKTTYIAAMWYMLFHNKKSSLNLGQLNGEDEYLNLICDKWMTFEKVLRTQLKNAGEKISLNVSNKDTAKTTVLNIPDFSGKHLKITLTNAEWTEDFNEVLFGTSGILLFVNPTQANNQPQLVIHESELLRLFDDEPLTNEGVTFDKYDPSHTPNQVKIVEELQFFEKYGKLDLPVKLAIIVSQWDVIESPTENKILPEDWLKLHLPLLYQYYQCNSSIYEVKVYGVSAQGGDYKDRELLADKEPTERVFIKDDKGIDHDILKPIIWITE